jgi:hypothetical protein
MSSRATQASSTPSAQLMQNSFTPIAGLKYVKVLPTAGDFNTDPTDPRFAAEQSCALLLSEKFAWAWDNVTLSERVTLLAKGRNPDASFDGLFIRGNQNFACKPIRITEVSDHFPAVLVIAIE